MNNEGSVFNAEGKIHRLAILTIDAYGVAVKNGFKGTVEEWLESLKGKDATDEQIAAAVEDYMAEHPIEVPEPGGGTVKTVNGVEPDENGNVQITIPDSGGKVVILPETDVVSDYDGWYITTFIPNVTTGKTYTVKYNGVPYECVGVAVSVDGLKGVGLGNQSLIGGEDTGEPFGLLVLDKESFDAMGLGAVVLRVSGDHPRTVGIEGEKPDGLDIINKGTVGQTVKITAVDENGKPTAWEAVDFPDSGGNADQETTKYLGDLRRTPIYRCLNIYLDGDTTDMTKDNAVMLDILILDEYGNVKFDGKSQTAWQGSGSLQYPNKNLSLKLRDKNDEESKVKLSVFPEYAASTYHLKCNYADYSMVRNSVGVRIAKGFDDTVFPVDAPMVVSSIPAILYLNGEFNGCYTLNTKQDDDLFGMDTKENPLTQIVYRSGLGSWTMSNFEYRSDGTETAETKAKLQRLMDFCANADDTTFVRDFENYLSLRNAINYWIFADVACASDSMINNWTIGTWDGLKWYMIWYDLDIIFGLFRNANMAIHPSQPTSDLLNLQYTVANPIWAKLYRNFFDNIRERYWELRNSGALTPTAIVNQFRTFQAKWGTELVEKDRAKWTGRLNKSDDITMMHGWISERLAYLDEKYHGTGVETEKTLASISATYSGGNIAVGTAVTNLTGIVVIAHYSDGTSKSVTGYTLSGTITEGSNTVTVSYGGKTTTFTVNGVAESGGENEPTENTYTITKNLTNVNTFESVDSVEENSSYVVTLNPYDGYTINTVSVTMGGADVTSTVYANGVITIESVTGDIIITAKAVAVAVAVAVKDGIATINELTDGFVVVEGRLTSGGGI